MPGCMNHDTRHPTNPGKQSQKLNTFQRQRKNQASEKHRRKKFTTNDTLEKKKIPRKARAHYMKHPETNHTTYNTSWKNPRQKTQKPTTNKLAKTRKKTKQKPRRGLSPKPRRDLSRKTPCYNKQSTAHNIKYNMP